MSPAGLETKNVCTGEGQQQFTRQTGRQADRQTDSRKSEVGVGGYRFRAFSCIVKRRYQATTNEDIADWEDLVFAAVIRTVYRWVKVL
jgi:hypothetical protein